jgi:predicted DNA-binding protein YlxM (UPF0122 family)
LRNPQTERTITNLLDEGFSTRKIAEQVGVSNQSVHRIAKKQGRIYLTARELPLKTFRDRIYKDRHDIKSHHVQSGGRFFESHVACKDLFGRRHNIFVTHDSPEFGHEGFTIYAILPTGRLERLSALNEFPTKYKAMKRAPKLAARFDQFELIDDVDL